jgi:hypothetical protein
MEERRGQPDHEFAVAKETGCQRDQPGDEWRLRVIAPGEMFRPTPVLRLVGIKVGRL